MHTTHRITSRLLMGLRCLEKYAPPHPPTTGRGNCSSDVKPFQKGGKEEDKDRGRVRDTREHEL